jgi:hypothetical protein
MGPKRRHRPDSMKEVLSTEEASPTNDTGMNPGADAFSSSTHSIKECQVPIIFHLSWHSLFSSIKLFPMRTRLLSKGCDNLTYQRSLFELRIVDPCIL